MRPCIGHIEVIAPIIAGDVHRPEMRPSLELVSRSDRPRQRIDFVSGYFSCLVFGRVQKLRPSEVNFRNGDVNALLAGASTLVPRLHERVVGTFGKVDVRVQLIRANLVSPDAWRSEDSHCRNAPRARGRGRSNIVDRRAKTGAVSRRRDGDAS